MDNPSFQSALPLCLLSLSPSGVFVSLRGLAQVGNGRARLERNHNTEREREVEEGCEKKKENKKRCLCTIQIFSYLLH